MPTPEQIAARHLAFGAWRVEATEQSSDDPTKFYITAPSERLFKVHVYAKPEGETVLEAAREVSVALCTSDGKAVETSPGQYLIAPPEEVYFGGDNPTDPADDLATARMLAAFRLDTALGVQAALPPGRERPAAPIDLAPPAPIPTEPTPLALSAPEETAP